MSGESSAIVMRVDGPHGVMWDEDGTRHEITPDWYREHGYRVTDCGDGFVMVQQPEETP